MRGHDGFALPSQGIETGPDHAAGHVVRGDQLDTALGIAEGTGGESGMSASSQRCVVQSNTTSGGPVTATMPCGVGGGAVTVSEPRPTRVEPRRQAYLTLPARRRQVTMRVRFGAIPTLRASAENVALRAVVLTSRNRIWPVGTNLGDMRHAFLENTTATIGGASARPPANAAATAVSTTKSEATKNEVLIDVEDSGGSSSHARPLHGSGRHDNAGASEPSPLATWADVAACSRGFAALGKAREPQGAAPSLLTATG
jgi:hypothetical protein